MNAAFQTTAYELARSAIQSAQREASFKLTKAFPDCMDDSIVPAIRQAFRLISEDGKLLDGWIQRSMDDAPKLVDPMWIRAKDIPPDYLRSLSGHWTWSVPPEVQIEMQPYKVVGRPEGEYRIHEHADGC